MMAAAAAIASAAAVARQRQQQQVVGSSGCPLPSLLVSLALLLLSVVRSLLLSLLLFVDRSLAYLVSLLLCRKPIRS